jgi:hypothetical protein
MIATSGLAWRGAHAPQLGDTRAGDAPRSTVFTVTAAPSSLAVDRDVFWLTR